MIDSCYPLSQQNLNSAFLTTKLPKATEAMDFSQNGFVLFCRAKIQSFRSVFSEVFSNQNANLMLALFGFDWRLTRITCRHRLVFFLYIFFFLSCSCCYFQLYFVINPKFLFVFFFSFSFNFRMVKPPGVKLVPAVV